MTWVYAEAADGRFLLSARGHATGSEAGCAFISGILYALAGYLSNAEAEGCARIGRMKLEPGDVSIRAQGGERIQAAFDMAVIGLLQLEKQYPELVRVEISGK
ncbi:MAG: ribosomal-processing cysteine protease Prp [Oscillibacter sp.]|nr:ribosomal-processing cysteine protease Prp [Oscillibacter sp.]